MADPFLAYLDKMERDFMDALRSMAQARKCYNAFLAAVEAGLAGKADAPKPVTASAAADPPAGGGEGDGDLPRCAQPPTAADTADEYDPGPIPAHLVRARV